MCVCGGGGGGLQGIHLTNILRRHNTGTTVLPEVGTCTPNKSNPWCWSLTVIAWRKYVVCMRQ